MVLSELTIDNSTARPRPDLYQDDRQASSAHQQHAVDYDKLSRRGPRRAREEKAAPIGSIQSPTMGSSRCPALPRAAVLQQLFTTGPPPRRRRRSVDVEGSSSRNALSRTASSSGLTPPRRAPAISSHARQDGGLLCQGGRVLPRRHRPHLPVKTEAQLLESTAIYAAVTYTSRPRTTGRRSPTSPPASAARSTTDARQVFTGMVDYISRRGTTAPAILPYESRALDTRDPQYGISNWTRSPAPARRCNKITTAPNGKPFNRVPPRAPVPSRLLQRLDNVHLADPRDAAVATVRDAGHRHDRKRRTATLSSTRRRRRRSVWLPVLLAFRPPYGA